MDPRVYIPSVEFREDPVGRMVVCTHQIFMVSTAILIFAVFMTISAEVWKYFGMSYLMATIILILFFLTLLAEIIVLPEVFQPQKAWLHKAELVSRLLATRNGKEQTIYVLATSRDGEKVYIPLECFLESGTPFNEEILLIGKDSSKQLQCLATIYRPGERSL